MDPVATQAAPPVAVIGPTGERGMVAAEDLPIAKATGSRPLTDAELGAFKTQRAHENSITEMAVARQVGTLRGAGEAFGIPLDNVAKAIGGEGAKDYLRNLKEWHPYASTIGDVVGQASGFTIQSELTGGAGAAAGVAGKLARGAAVGGVESLVANTTSDINEATLGDHEINAEKILAAAPGHLFWGALAGGAVAGAGHVLGSALSKGAKAAGQAADAGATRLVGRELGAAGEEASTIGGRVRSEMGSVPKSTGEIADFYGAQQQQARAAAQYAHAGEVASMGERHAVESADLAARGGGVRSAQEVKEAVQTVGERHRATFDALASESEKAEAIAKEAVGRLKENADQVKTLASRLDNVSGAERPRASVLTEALESADSMPGNAVLTPRGQAAMRGVDTWIKGFNKANKTEASFTKMRQAGEALDALAASSGDETAKQMIGHVAEAARAEFNRASAATASMAGEGVGLHAERLRDMGAELSKAHEVALADVATQKQTLADFTQQAAAEAKSVNEWAKVAKGERAEFTAQTKAQGKAQEAEVKGIPKPSTETPADEMVARAQAAMNREKPPLISPAAAWSALLAAAHGNVAGAAGAVGASVATGVAFRNIGNLGAARTLDAISKNLSGVDASLQHGALGSLGRVAREGALAISRQDFPTEPAPRLTFDRVLANVRATQANPQLIDGQVNSRFGEMAQYAPNTYGSILATAQRAQSFMERSIPPARRDEFSPTAHLEPDSFSESEKYDFMTSAKVVADPLSVLRSIKSGSLSDRQVTTVQEVYPGLYGQMKGEITRILSQLQVPIHYETSVQLGTLFQMSTSEVMEPDFQKAQAAMFEERVKEEKMPGNSPPRGPNAKMSKANMSGSEKVESGEGY